MHYLIEFRFRGKAKFELKKLIWDVDRNCNIGNAKKKRPVPHITLVAPFQTKHERKLIRDFYDVCSKSPLMRFVVNGFNTFENNGVVYVEISPSGNLDKFRWDLSKKLQPYCKLQSIDHERKYHFHSTVAMKLTPQKFNQVKSYIRSKPKPDFRHVVVRVTLLKGGKILREYDFIRRQMFNRRRAKSKKVYNRTIDLLKRYFDGSYNPDDKPKISFWTKIKSFFGR